MRESGDIREVRFDDNCGQLSRRIMLNFSAVGPYGVGMEPVRGQLGLKWTPIDTSTNW